ncbi:hypothetical protein EDD37DRAFT_380419 [Exophiala viscosa]|uniref:Uncharacterized protein n=1 Tax=Exophiala viscosa TaxID=2486360 RepID=A0AAN6DNB4_9EURO|nr:hypothetical protein EDD36DRAFT_55569 [Exophiala viscosa]KAI1625210.1 hypothetical protein EDD37DRAFT_380419 [Exophiala viscosa]
MTLPIVTTLNRSDGPPDAPTLSALSVVPLPPVNPTAYLLQTAGQIGKPPPTTPSTPFPTSFHEQAANAFANVGACLGLKGATPRDITKITIYVVNLNASHREPLIDVIRNFFRIEGQESHKPPSSLIGVAGLASPDFMIEVEATAVVAA